MYFLGIKSLLLNSYILSILKYGVAMMCRDQLYEIVLGYKEEEDP